MFGSLSPRFLFYSYSPPSSSHLLYSLLPIRGVGCRKGYEKLLLIARKQSHKSGCSYHIFNVSRGHLGNRLKKKGGNVSSTHLS